MEKLMHFSVFTSLSFGYIFFGLISLSNLCCGNQAYSDFLGSYTNPFEIIHINFRSNPNLHLKVLQFQENQPLVSKIE